MGYKKKFKQDLKEIMQYVEKHKQESENALKIVDSHNRILRLMSKDSIGYYRYESEYGTFKVRSIAAIMIGGANVVAISDYDELGRLLQFRYDSGVNSYYIYRTPTTFTTGAKIICNKNKVVQVILSKNITEESVLEEVKTITMEFIKKHQLDDSYMEPIIEAHIKRE